MSFAAPSNARFRTHLVPQRSPDKGPSVLCVPRASHYTYGKNRDRKLGIEQMNKVPCKIKISYLLVELFERPLNIPINNYQ